MEQARSDEDAASKITQSGKATEQGEVWYKT